MGCGCKNKTNQVNTPVPVENSKITTKMVVTQPLPAPRTINENIYSK